MSGCSQFGRGNGLIGGSRAGPVSRCAGGVGQQRSIFYFGRNQLFLLPPSAQSQLSSDEAARALVDSNIHDIHASLLPLPSAASRSTPFKPRLHFVGRRTALAHKKPEQRSSSGIRRAASSRATCAATRPPQLWSVTGQLI